MLQAIILAFTGGFFALGLDAYLDWINYYDEIPDVKDVADESPSTEAQEYEDIGGIWPKIWRAERSHFDLDALATFVFAGICIGIGVFITVTNTSILFKGLQKKGEEKSAASSLLEVSSGVGGGEWWAEQENVAQRGDVMLSAGVVGGHERGLGAVGSTASGGALSQEEESRKSSGEKSWHVIGAEIVSKKKNEHTNIEHSTWKPSALFDFFGGESSFLEEKPADPEFLSADPERAEQAIRQRPTILV